MMRRKNKLKFNPIFKVNIISKAALEYSSKNEFFQNV